MRKCGYLCLTGLFHRAISQSGSALCPWGMMKRPKWRAQLQAVLVGCPSAPSQELVKCLQTKDAYDIIETFPKHFVSIALATFREDILNLFVII